MATNDKNEPEVAPDPTKLVEYEAYADFGSRTPEEWKHVENDNKGLDLKTYFEETEAKLKKAKK